MYPICLALLMVNKPGPYGFMGYGSWEMCELCNYQRIKWRYCVTEIAPFLVRDTSHVSQIDPF